MTTIKKLMRSLVFVMLLAVSSITLSGCSAAQAFQIVAAVLGGIANIFQNVAGIVGGGGGGEAGGNPPAAEPGAANNNGAQAGTAAAANPDQPAAAQAPAQPANNQPVFTAPPITTTPGSALDTMRKQPSTPAVMSPDAEKTTGGAAAAPAIKATDFAPLGLKKTTLPSSTDPILKPSLPTNTKVGQ